MSLAMLLVLLPLSFTLTPQVCAGPPCPVIMLITIEPDEANRSFNMVIEGDREGSERREFDFPVEGNKAPKNTQVTVVLKANAEYEFKGTLSRNDDKKFYFKRYVKVGVE